MAKPDYKKLWEQQKEQNILLRTENEKLYALNGHLSNKIDDDVSWEQLYNKQQGQATGIMSCFKELLKSKINNND